MVKKPVEKDEVQIAMRLPSAWRDAVAAWAEQEHRSLNGQVLVMIEGALKAAGRFPGDKSRK